MIRLVLALSVSALAMVALMAYPIHVRMFSFFVEHAMFGTIAVSACVGAAIFAAVKK